MRDPTDADRVKGLLEVNARQVDMIDHLERSLSRCRRISAELRSANDDLQRRLEAHDTAQTLRLVAEPDPLGRDWRES